MTGVSRVVLAMAMAGGCVFSQAATNQDVELPPVTVAAHDGVEVPYNNTGVSVSILNSEQLQKEGVITMTEALTRVPGLYTTTGGSTYQRGSVSFARIRGMNSSDYTLTMVDGMRLYRIGSLAGPVFMGTTDLFSVGNTEVVRGSEGAVYGAGAIGGVVATNTPQGQGKPSFKVFTEAGSFDSFTGAAIAQGQVGKLDYFVSATYERTNNDPTTAAPILDRHASKFEQWSEAVRLGYQISDSTKLTFTYRRQDAQANQPQPCATDYDPVTFAPMYGGFARVSDYYRTNLATMKLDTQVNRIWSSSLMVGYYGFDYTDTYSPRFSGYDTFDSNLRNVQIEWRNLMQWSKQHRTTAGFAWNRAQFVSNYETRNLENTYGLFAEHMYSPVSGLDLSAAARLDSSTIWDELFTYRAAASWKVTGEKSPTRLFGSFGSGYRAPSAFERFADCTIGYSRYKGNPDLKVSKSIGGDLGVEQRVADKHYLTVTGFWTRINDQIGATADYSSWTNYSYATSVGVECSLRGEFGDAWNSGYTLAYTYTVPKNNADQQLSYTARSVWSADIHTSPIASVTTGLGVTAASGRSAGVGSRIDSYCVLRWYARWQATDNLAFHVRVENMGNDRFVTQPDYSGNSTYDIISAGTAVYGGVTLTF